MTPHADTWRAAQRRRSLGARVRRAMNRAGRRLFRVVVIAMALMPLAACVAIVASGGAR